MGCSFLFTVFGVLTSHAMTSGFTTLCLDLGLEQVLFSLEQHEAPMLRCRKGLRHAQQSCPTPCTPSAPAHLPTPCWKPLSNLRAPSPHPGYHAVHQAEDSKGGSDASHVLPGGVSVFGLQRHTDSTRPPRSGNYLFWNESSTTTGFQCRCAAADIWDLPKMGVAMFRTS